MKCITNIVSYTFFLPQDTVWGVAYKIKESEVPAVTKHLDFREKGGYKQATVTFYPRAEDIQPFDLKLYVGTEDNPFYLGPAPISEMALQIFNSVGPSGPNKEYILNLADALRRIAPEAEDEHLYSIEAALTELEKKENGAIGTGT